MYVFIAARVSDGHMRKFDHTRPESTEEGPRGSQRPIEDSENIKEKRNQASLPNVALGVQCGSLKESN